MGWNGKVQALTCPSSIADCNDVGFVIRIVFTRAFLLHNSCLAVCVLPIMAAVITVSKGSLMSIAAPRDKCVMFVGVQGRGVEARLLREAVARRPWPDFSYDY